MSEKLLQEKDRARLDKIVQEMIKNNETDADIRFVVNDFKNIYGLESTKKKDDTSNVGSGSGALESGKSQSTSQSPKSSKPIIGTIQAQSNESPYIKVGINKPSVSTSKETKIVENEKKPIIGTKEAQQHKSIVSVDIPIKPLPTEEERDKALDKAKAEIELVKITNNFDNKKEDGSDDIAMNVTDYYNTSLREKSVNDLSQSDQLILQLSESTKAIKNEQELINQQFNAGKISENTYNVRNKELEKNRTDLELKTTSLISERNKDIDNEINALKQNLLNGKITETINVDAPAQTTMYSFSGGTTQKIERDLSDKEKISIKNKINLLEKQKSNISENLKMQDNEIDSLQGTLQESERQGLIPKGATLEQALKIQYAKNDQTLKMLKEQSAKEGNPFVSSTSGMWDNAKEFVGDMLGHETLSKYNPETKQMEYQKFKSGYGNTPRQYLINDKTANKIYELQEQQKALSSIIELDRYGNYKKDSGLANFTKQFIQSLAPTQKGKILTQSEIASATQQALNNAGIHEIQDVTGKVLNDNKHNISDMLGTTASFMVQFSLTPNVIGKVLSLGKLGMRYNAIRKVAENIEKGIKFTEKSRLGRLFGKMVETGVEYKGKGLLNAQLEKEADFGSGAFGVLGEKLLTKMFPFGAGRWASVIGRGWGELGEETGQQIWQTYKDNGYHIDETIQGLKQQFPEMKDVQMFVFGTALMGMGFGLGSKSTGNEKKISQEFGEWREKQIKKLLDEGKITQGELNKVNGIINDLTTEHTNAINQELKDGVSITDEEKSELIKNSKNVTEVKGKDGKITTTITNENGEQIAIKDNKLYILDEEATSEYTANADGSVMHGARVIDNPNGLTETELIKQDIESRKQQELIKADESGADKNEIEQRYNNELENLDKNGVGKEQEQEITNSYNGETTGQQYTDVETKKAEIEKKRQEELDSVSKVINQDDKNILETNINKRYDNELNKLKTNETTSTQPINTGQEQNNSKGVQESQQNNNGLGAGNGTTAQDEATKQKKQTIQAEIETTNDIISELEGKNGITAKASLLKQKAKLEELNKQLADINKQESIITDTNNQKGTEQPVETQKRILDINNDEVLYKGKKGKIIVDTENNVIFSSADVDVELGKTTNEEFTNMSIDELGIKLVVPTNPAILIGNTIEIDGKKQELVSINHDNNGNVVSYTYTNEKGEERTNRDTDIALDIAIQKNNQDFDKSRENVKDTQQDELEVLLAVREEYGDNISSIFETMPDEVYETMDLMDKGILIEPNSIQGMVSRTLEEVKKAKKKIKESGVDRKAKMNSLEMLNKFENDLKKYNEKLNKKSEFSNENATETETVKSNAETNQETTEKGLEKKDLQKSEESNNLNNKNNENEPNITTTDNIEQEPNIKDIESKSESENEIEPNTAVEQANKTLNRANVFITPFSELSVDADRFQPREKQSSKDVEVAVDELLKEYSGEQKETLKSKIIKIINETTGSLESIKRVVNNFDSNKLDPLKTWKDPKDGKTYVANHSRLAGHKILSILPDTDERVIKAKESGFEKGYILTHPTNYKTEQEFVENAQNSNDEATRNTILESANRIRKWAGLTKKQIKEKAENIFRKDANFLINLASLNINGKAINLLKSVEKSTDKTSQKEAEKIADWIGEVRKQNSNITNQHENELFDFLMDKDNSKRIRDKAEFLSKVASITNNIHFNPDNPLNIARYKYQTEGEKQYDKEVEERKDKISELQQKINDINDRFKNPNNPNYVSTDHKDYDSIKAQADKVIADTNVQLKAEQKALQELYQQKGKYTNSGSNQGNLFEPKNEVYETTAKTTNQKGETVQLQIQFASMQGNNDYPSTNDVQQEKDKTDSPSIVRTIIGVWNEFKNIQFAGTTKVKNASDVAHIMRLLEDKSVEQAFAVHIDSKGDSHIQFLSIGGISGTVVDSRLVLSGVTKFKSKKVYLVHNHPSGNMTPSTQDKKLTLQIAQGLKTLNVDLEHIIMDTYKQEYLVLNNSGEVDGTYKRNERNSGENLTTHIFDGVKVLSEPLMDIKSSQNVAEFLYQKRFSVLPKNGFIILNNKNQIIGNYVFKNNLDIKEILLNIGETPTATSIILYSNAPAPTNLKEVSLQLKKLDIGLLDYVEVKGGGDDIKGAYDYVSATDNGLIYELQEKYGTNNLGNTDILFQQSTDNNTETTSQQQKEAKSVIKFLSDKFKGLFADGQKAFDEKLKSLGIDESFLKFMADYRGLHKAPQKEGANSLDDMSDIFPSDLYSPKGFYYYADSHTSKADKESYKVIVEAKGKPNKKVKIYRAVPKGVTEINSGDWVTLSKEYAKMHGEHSLNGKYDIIETEVEAGKLFNEGSYNEFGVQFLKDKDGTVFGLYDPTENKIYLNERNLNPKTVWHEATHFQQAILKAMAQNGNKEAKKILAQFDKLLKPFVEQLLLGRTTVTIDEQRIPLKADVYRKGANETTKAYKERMQDELWAFLQQEENHKLWQKNDTPFKRAVNKFKEAVTNLFKSILDIPKHKDISNMTLSELVGHTAKQLQDGRLEDSRNGEKGEVRMMTMPDGTKRQVKVLPEVTNGFYSPIEKKLLDEKAENLSATKWLERLGKGDEMQFTGLKDFLESKKPNEQVKKSDIQDFMRDNRIEVVEVVKGEDMPNYKLEIEPPTELGADRMDLLGDLGRAGNLDNPRFRDYLNKKYGKNGNKIYDWLVENATVEGTYSKDTKFSEYQLSGDKENYKEVLVTMPKIEYDYKKEIERKFIKDKYDSHIKDGDSHETALKTIKRYVAQDKTIEEIDAIIKSKPQEEVQNFESSHWEEPNILVHLRMNTRTDADGNKVLFLEEVQSDHNQEARKKGVRNEKEMKRISELADLFLEDRTKNQEGTPERIEYEKLTARNNTQGVPDAPFIKDTNATTKLGLKVALKEAVKQGADKIAWTTGEQQNERYDLSKQVDDVYTSSYGEEWVNGKFEKRKDVEITLKGGEVNKFVVDENGKVLSGDFIGERLDNIIGKEMAEKILSAKEDTNFGSQDLKVGGKGMKGFYGSPTEGSLGIVGNVAKKLFGQEPTTIKLKDGTEQHAVTITPEMRETVQEGQPLFMAGKEDPTPITLVSDKKSNNDIRFQILGEKGAEALDKFDEATHRMDNLSIARQMEEANKTPKEIRLATGWERGKDKKWRYEIEDIEIDINKSKATYLDEITTNDKGLFISHPELKGIDVIISIDSKNNNTASYTPFEDRSGLGLFDIQKHITVEAKTKEDVKTLLLHEIQHAIQDIEGFAEGGNPKMAENLVDRNRAKEYTNKHNAITLGFNEKERTLKNRIFNSTDYIDSFSKKEYDKYLVFSNIYHLLSNGETLKELPDLLRIRHENIFKTKKEANAFLINNKPIIQNILRDIEKKIKEFEAEKKELIKETNEEINNLKYEYYDTSPYKQYKRLAGEVESRNVQSRMNMTPEQRRETLLTETEDVAREDQIVMMEGVEQAMSLSETKPITQTQSKTLIDRLNKAFGGKVRLFSDWSRFIEQNKALQGFKSLDDIIFSQTLDKVNKAFNEQLDKLIKGTLPKGHIFQLGNAGAILKASGIEELPIELSADRTKEKSEQPNHPFDLNDLKNLTKAVQNPIAVFDSTKKDGSKIILTELKDKKGNNYVVALRVSNKGAGRLNVEINDVKSVYPKDHTQGVLDWINSEGNLLRYADKEKALNYISVQSTNLIGNGNTEKGSNTKIQHKPNNAVEKIKNFKNPISDKEVDDVRFSVNKNYIGEALYIINKNAKKLRDLKRDLYNFQKYGDVTSGLAERAGVSEFNFSEEKNSLVVYEENGKAYYDIKDIEDAIKNQEREVSFIENNDNYDEDELDFEKSYLNNLESIKETFENNIEKIKGVYMFDLSDELNRLYEFKGKVISKIGGKAIGVHVFPKGDVRELYKIGDFVFHGEDVSDDYTKEEILKLDKLGEISSDIKIDNIKSLEDAISEIEKKLGIQFMQLPDGTIYGAVLPDGSMYLNPENLNTNTHIHEHTHLFNQVIQQTNPKLWNRMVEAVKGIGLWNEVKNDPNYKNLKTDSQIADEVYSRLTGNKGEVNWQERIAKADSKSRLAKVGELIKEYWNNVMDILGIKKMSADDFANMTLDKLFSGKEIKGVKDVLEAGNNLNNQIKSATDNVGTFSNESNDIRFSISDNGGQNLSEAERQEIKDDFKIGLKLGSTVDEIREMYVDADEIDISKNDFDDLMSEAQKELGIKTNEKTTKIDDDTQGTPKENKKDKRKKTYEWHRVHEGKFPKELIENLEKYDLDHEVESQELAEKRALAIIDNFGIENALKSVEKGYIKGAEKAVVYSKAVEFIQEEMLSETDPKMRENLKEDLSDIIRKIGNEMRDAGRFSSMWARIYKNSPLGYNAEYYINNYKNNNGGEIPKEIEDKFKEMEATITEQNKKIAELEKKQQEEIDKQTIESITNNPPNKKDSKNTKSIKEKAKSFADKFRKLKTKPFTLKDADGNDIIITQNSIVSYNDIIEAGARIIEEAGKLGESIEMAVRKAREYVVTELEKQDWYKNLPQRDKDAVNTQLLEHFSIEETIESEYKIPKGLLYELTKDGIERKGKDNYTIDDLVDDVYDVFKEQYPDLDKRQIRDDISNYGKTINMSKEDVDVKLRELRRDGKMLSAYEDLLNGNLPKRSGLQRDGLTPSQREMQKKINNELRKIPKSAEQVASDWKSALDTLKRKYKNQIEDLEKQINKRERVVKLLNKTVLDEDTQKLKDRVEELKKELDELVGKPEMSEQSKINMIESNLTKAIKDTEDKIKYIEDNGTEPTTPIKRSVTSDKINALKDELKQKKERLKEVREQKGLVEKKRLEMAKKRIEKQTEELKERIKNGDFEKKKRTTLPYDTELNDLKREKLKVQEQFEYLFYKNKLENRNLIEKLSDLAFEVWNLAKGLKASVDYSAPLRQGSMLMFTNPIIFAKSWKKMYGYSFSEEKFENSIYDIKNHKDYVLMSDSGVALTNPNGELMAREEVFMSNLPKKIPFLKHAFAGSERAYSGFLNNLRTNIFLEGVEVLKDAGLTFENDPKAYKDLAKYINYATGRGDITSSEGINKLLNSIFFSPRMITSRVQMVLLVINPNTNPQVRKMALKSLVSFAMYWGLLGMLGSFIFGDKEDKDKNKKNFFNPTHTDFSKVRSGDYTYDMTSGYSTLLRTIARYFTEEKETSSGIKKLDGSGYGRETAFSEVGNFFTNKLAPLPATYYKVKTNQNPRVYGKKWDETSAEDKIIDLTLSLTAPISIEDMYEIATDKNISNTQSMFNIVLGLHGGSVQNYGSSSNNKKTKKGF